MSSLSFSFASYIPNWVQESLVCQKYQCMQKEKAPTKSLFSQLKDQERAVSQDRQHKKVSALLQPDNTENIVAPCPPCSKGELSLLPGCNEVPQTLQDGVREGREQDLTRHFTSLCYQWIQCGERGIPVRGVTRHLPCSLGHSQEA